MYQSTHTEEENFCNAFIKFKKDHILMGQYTRLINLMLRIQNIAKNENMLDQKKT